MSEYQKLWYDLKKQLIYRYEAMEEEDLIAKTELLDTIFKMDKMEAFSLQEEEL
ncbi:hypothetical protein [Diplocloster modestus]|uniref:Uncharacterized protein n=1 Tax=Diplocloster modestus TaxID=2850322 RepID=A0ABS6K0N3_9FIRM|nr:hypothetical protein [Diplocloster modestus]MBU9724406.1 hypothetical protein [Diplocloster modestus]